MDDSSSFSPLTHEEKADIRNKVMEPNPGATVDEFKAIYNAAVFDAIDDPLSLRAQPNADAHLIAPSASSKENKYLAGFMRSPAKPQLDVEAQQALDKEPFSLISPLKQAEDGALEAQQEQRAGDVQGHIWRQRVCIAWIPLP